MPYASITGAPNTSSSSAITCGGSEAEEDRMKRSLAARACSGCARIRIRIAWCMVGTAVYQVGFTSPSSSANLNALKPGVQHTAALAESDAVTAAISP